MRTVLDKVDSVVRLTKFDVAERQLLLAIRLFFCEEDCVSIHTLSEVAHQVFCDIRSGFGAVSLRLDHPRIKPERKKEWIDVLARSRNFFKHADRDKSAVYEFRDSSDHFSLLECGHLYAAIKKHRVPETFLYEKWFALSYPDLMEDETTTIDLKRIIASGVAPDPRNKALFNSILLDLRCGKRQIENVVTYFGIQSHRTL